ncbi:MAG: hypothetical protein K2X03_02970 [Bryobacteraceae bacterium]|nr:hypothetical protein [Bryobacteraceae bacterium]
MLRFTAFAPVVEIWEQEPEAKTAADLVTPRPNTNAPSMPLDEIHAIEDEWRQRVQPEGLVEETLCSQLAHATWHLRCLHRAEREAILAAARNRSFNGEAALSLMTWRRSAEDAIQAAIGQLQTYRQIGPAVEPKLLPAFEIGDLLALSNSVSEGKPARERATSVGR